MDKIHVAQDGVQCRAFVNAVIKIYSIKYGEFIDQLSNYSHFMLEIDLC
jgi:hypothetical protein